MFQNQPFIDPLQNRCSQIIQKILGEKPVTESLFYKVAVLKACNLLKKNPTQVLCCEICKPFKTDYTFFIRTIRSTSLIFNKKLRTSQEQSEVDIP